MVRLQNVEFVNLNSIRLINAQENIIFGYMVIILNIFFEEPGSLLVETFNIAINDFGCTKTVCGKTWLKHYIDTISNDKKRIIKIEVSCISFRFGNTKIIKSNKLIIW